MNADPLSKETQLMEKVFKNPEHYPAINHAFATQGKIQDAINDYLDSQKRLNETSAKCVKLVDKCVELERLVSKFKKLEDEVTKIGNNIMSLSKSDVIISVKNVDTSLLGM